jgi:membrane protein DedA with SNARE-associated domain
MHDSRQPKTIALGLLGAAIGGTVGYFAFFWIASQGFYAIILPPVLLGLTAGYFARCRSMPLAIVCSVAGLALGLYTEWRFAPFVKDDSLSFFLTHVHEKQPVKLLMLALGVFMCYRFALGVDRKSNDV